MSLTESQRDHLRSSLSWVYNGTPHEMAIKANAAFDKRTAAAALLVDLIANRVSADGSTEIGWSEIASEAKGLAEANTEFEHLESLTAGHTANRTHFTGVDESDVAFVRDSGFTHPLLNSGM